VNAAKGEVLMIKKQFTLYLENRPGELSRVTGALAAADINIDGISVLSSADVGMVQVVPAAPEGVEELLRKEQVAFTVQEVSVTLLKNEPGALHSVLSKLADMGVNINYVYATGTNGGEQCRGCAVISAPNLHAVEDALA
jgi:hypothetical protein